MSEGITYRELWDAVVGEELECQQERGNATDLYAVVVIKDSTIVGHLQATKDF